MGAVIKRCVNWVGNVYNKFIKWFKKYKNSVNRKTEEFLNNSLEEIKNCEEPPKVGQYLAAKHEANQIQKIADKIGENLSSTDFSSAQEILDNYSFVDDLEITLDSDNSLISDNDLNKNKKVKK